MKFFRDEAGDIRPKSGYMARRPSVSILVANLPAERDRRVIRECLSLEAAGFDVTVIAPRGDKSLKILPGSRGTRLRPYPVKILGSGPVTFAIEFGWSFLCVAVRLLGELLRGRAQAVQVCNPPDVYWPLALLIRAIGRPWVFDHHDLCPEVYATRSNGSPNKVMFRTLVALEWLTLRTATHVFATNESFKENAERRGVRPGKVTVVRNGPAANEIAPVEPVAGGEHRIVYLGVIGPQDNVEGVVLAAEALRHRRPARDWRVVIAGDGEQMPVLTKMVADRGLGDVVEFAGWLDGSAVDDLLRSATVAIQPDLPTRMNDLSTMAKTVEYLGRGVPVVAADLTETRRSAADAAVYVPTGSGEEFAEAIDDLLDDPERRAQMRKEGLARFAERLSWDHQARMYIAIWKTLLAKKLPKSTVEIPRQRALPDAPASAGAGPEAERTEVGADR
jgi:glycosyltransferase involved in cell wall biosynthesis